MSTPSGSASPPAANAQPSDGSSTAAAAGDPKKPEIAQPGAAAHWQDRVDWGGFTGGLFMLLLFGIGGIASILSAGANTLDIVAICRPMPGPGEGAATQPASASTNPASPAASQPAASQPALAASAPASRPAFWRLEGRVFHDGTAVPNASILVIASDSRGNRFSPPLEGSEPKTDATGSFRTVAIPDRLGSEAEEAVANVTIQARATVQKDGNSLELRGKETRLIGPRAGTRWVEFSGLKMLLIPTLFAISVVLALLPFQNSFKYYGSVCLSFLLTGFMIAYIAIGLRFINSTSTPTEVVSLGFANLQFGTYVEKQHSEWLLSLTAPPFPRVVTSDGAALRGFGAPLWVLLVAVVGAGLFTISILVKQVSEPINFRDAADCGPKLRLRIEEIVKHQFYILFAPFGAVLVYQLLVTAGAASQQVTVALAALASGVALNPILEMALNRLGSVVKKDAGGAATGAGRDARTGAS